MFAVRVVMFFLLLGWLALYAINPTWMGVLSVPFPDWLRWVGFALGLASLGFWSWTQVALGKEWSPQLQLREEHHLVTTGPYTPDTPPALHGYAWLWDKPCPGDCQLGLYRLGSGGDRWLIRPRPQGRANDDRGVWGGI